LYVPVFVLPSLHAQSASPKYLGIPLALGFCTRFIMLTLTSHSFFHKRFLPIFSPLALLGLLYTILVMFAYQGHHILHNLGPVFRVFVPMVLYFCVMWTAGFALVWQLSLKHGKSKVWRYDMAVVQAFTAGSNNFVSQMRIYVQLY
jgi:arsenite transporter